MQNNPALMILVLTMSVILISNSGCGGTNPAQSSFGSISVPTTGVCGSSVVSADKTVTAVVSENTCYSGTLEDIADTTTLYKWNCLGTGGGRSAACSLAMPPASVLPGTSNGLMNDAGYFYVGVDTKAGAIAHVHASTGFATPCGISKDSVANEDITCIIEMPEGDIYGKNLEIKYNIPNGEMCRYIETEPYWFYNFEVGKGPASIAMSVDNTVNASGDITATTSSCNFDNLGVGPCSNGDLLVTINPTSHVFKCVYDHSAESGPNCCMGSISLTKTTTRNGASPITIRQFGDWGGNYTKCIGGPGRTNWPTYYSDGTPARIINFIDAAGLKNTQVVTAPSKLAKPLSPLTSSIHVASYYGDSATHTHTGFVNVLTTSSAPYFMDPIDDRSGTLIGPAHPSFEFQCLDAAFEVKHRIRAYVREWDTMPDFLAYVASSGTVVVPDRGNTSEPGTNCVGVVGLGNMCNDSWDIDDFLGLYLKRPSENLNDNFNGLAGVTYLMTPLTHRKQYFPRILYE